MKTSLKTILAAAAGAALLGGCADYYGNGYYGYDNGYNGYDSGYYGYDNGYGYGGYGYGPAYYDYPGYYTGPSIGLGIGFSDYDRHDRRHDRDGRHGGWRDHDRDRR